MTAAMRTRTRSDRMVTRAAFAAAALPVLALAAGFEAAAQTPQAQQPPSQTQTTFILGGPCTRKPDGSTGIVKRDACGRWYCSSKLEVKSVSEAQPNTAALLGCTWRMEVSTAGTFCICRFPETSPKPK